MNQDYTRRFGGARGETSSNQNPLTQINNFTRQQIIEFDSEIYTENTTECLQPNVQRPIAQHTTGTTYRPQVAPRPVSEVPYRPPVPPRFANRPTASNTPHQTQGNLSSTQPPVSPRNANEITILNDLKKIQDLIYSQEFSLILKDVENRNINLFLGNTRSGKSTVINCLIGNRMTAVFVQKNKFHIINEDMSSGPTIGVTGASETTLPGVWKSRFLSGLIVDAPGFEDNRGHVQDIVNAFYVRELITKASSVKIVIVVDINDILLDNINHFIRVIDYLYDMLTDSNTVLKGTSVIFNKDRDDYNREEISELLNTKFLVGKKIEIKNKNLITHLCRNNAQISIMRMPKTVGPLDELAIKSIINSIDYATVPIDKMELKNMNSGISDKSRLYLIESYKHLTERNDFENVLEKLFYKFEEAVSFASNFEVLSKEMLKIERKRLFAIKQNLKELECRKLRIQEALFALSLLLTGDRLETIDEDICTKLDFLAFIDNITGTNQSITQQLKLNALITYMISHCKELEICFQENLEEITAHEAEQNINAVRTEIRGIKQNLETDVGNLEKKDGDTLSAQLKDFRLLTAAGNVIDTAVRGTVHVVGAGVIGGVNFTAKSVKYLGKGFMGLFSKGPRTENQKPKKSSKPGLKGKKNCC